MTDIKWTAASAVVLYFCTFNWGTRRRRRRGTFGGCEANIGIAPHLVEYVSKLF
jgi:hypothetical protein